MVTVRRATMDDARETLDWRNDPHTRSMFRDQNPVSEESHMKWFANTLANPDRAMFIGEQAGAKVGVIRFDLLEDDVWEVSHNMAPIARGRGLGQAMVNAVLAEFRCSRIIAEIKQVNRPCWHIYEKCGFTLASEDDDNRHYELVRSQLNA